jgi:hypothetical protein
VCSRHPSEHGMRSRQPARRRQAPRSLSIGTKATSIRVRVVVGCLQARALGDDSAGGDADLGLGLA